MNQPCGCCEGVQRITPANTANRPGLSTLVYRVGTHATFLETMEARLSSLYLGGYLFSLGDLQDPTSLAAKLTDAQDPLSLFLRASFWPRTLQLLDKYDGSSLPSGSLQTALVDELNRVLHRRSLYDPQLFASIPLTDEIQELILRNPQGEELIRLNRRLLEAAYPREIASGQVLYPLLSLSTRSENDPSIALLDSWATVADVLTFYEERIANEGYLHTATERRSILELAHLVGYTLRPGVAASVYLAFTMENDFAGEIPAGTRAQSLPGPGELPQSFETSEKLPARAEWNNLTPRLTRPQRITCDDDPACGAENISTLYFQGTSTNLKVNDPLLIVCGNDKGQQLLRFIQGVNPQSAENRTEVTLQPLAVAAPRNAPDVINRLNQHINEASRLFPDSEIAKKVGDVLLKDLVQKIHPSDAPLTVAKLLREVLPQLQKARDLAIKRKYTRLAPWISGLVDTLTTIANELATGEFSKKMARSAVGAGTTRPDVKGATSFTSLPELLKPLSIPPSLQPANALILRRSVQQAFAPQADITPRLLTALRPAVAPLLYKAWANVVSPPTEVKVYALRVKAALFGHNAPLRQTFTLRGVPNPPKEWQLSGQFDQEDKPLPLPSGQATLAPLDAQYDKIVAGTWIVIQRPDQTKPIYRQASSVQTLSMAKYGITGRVTQLTLDSPWLKGDDFKETLALFRGTAVLAQAEVLELVEEPIDADIEGNTIDMDRLYDGLDSGRWIIVHGERTDIPDVTGVTASELVMLTGVRQGERITGSPDKTHTTLILANKLAYAYKPDTVTIYGNVVKATHGETRGEVLGSGDGSKALQQFPVRQSPLTYLSAPTPAGAQSTLQARVNDILWHEADNLAGLKRADRDYITQTDDADKTMVTFGNGEHGARLPTGVENVKALYRSGIGKPGNVKARQISLLATRPLGVKSVINPLAATGGADRDSRDQARRNAPLAVMALDRLVSVRDYADFARTFAGIGKASATRLSDGRHQLVHVTIAGAEDIPIDKNSELYRNLTQALHEFSDPFQATQIAIRKLKLLVVIAKVRVLPDYQFESVAPNLRAALLDTFGFDHRELGQSAFLSEVISTMQAVEGVAYVDVENFDAVPEDIPVDELTKLAATLQRKDPRDPIEADLARVNPDPTADPRILPAELAILSPNVPDTLILTELTG